VVTVQERPASVGLQLNIDLRRLRQLGSSRRLAATAATRRTGSLHDCPPALFRAFSAQALRYHLPPATIQAVAISMAFFRRVLSSFQIIRTTRLPPSQAVQFAFEAETPVWARWWFVGSFLAVDVGMWYVKTNAHSQRKRADALPVQELFLLLGGIGHERRLAKTVLKLTSSDHRGNDTPWPLSKL
jgi:hypothetical protein